MRNKLVGIRNPNGELKSSKIQKTNVQIKANFKGDAETNKV